MEHSNGISVLDREVALARVGGDEELLSEIAELFLEDYPSQLATLSEAVDRLDASVIYRTAHTLKGSVATFGAQPAVDAAFALEQAGRAEQLSGAPEMLRDLQALLRTLHVELQTL